MSDKFVKETAKKMLNVKRALILSPHTDDGEFSCGATISRLINENIEITYIAFSAAEDSVPEPFPNDILRKEVLEATGVLGIPKSHVHVLNYTVRKFPQYRQEILEEMVKIGNDINPDIVFLPSTTDTHQDHQTVCSEGFRAFKRKTLLGYELPWNNLEFKTSAFFAVEEEHIQVKLKALNCYKSQSFRNYASEEFVRSLAITRGTQIGVRFAEAFEIIRLAVF